MKKYWKQFLFLVFLAVTASLLIWLKNTDFLTFENLKEHREVLKNYVENHYVLMTSGFIFVYLSTAFFIPGAVILTLAGGFLFGTIPGAVYVNIGATAGATIAFLLSRYLIGGWIQRRYENQLGTFNKEIARHGHNYLLTLRVIPILPFFVVNYLAGITEIPLKKFIWTTSLGMLPGSFLYAFAGQQLSTINSVNDVVSVKLVASLAILALLALLPVIAHYAKRLSRD